jgi:hypothetical protein
MFVADAGERWVVVHDEPHERVRRMRVPGGWLYQVEYIGTLESAGTAEARKYIEGWHPPVFVAATEVKNDHR